MARLKNRQHQIPQGFIFSLPEANWKSQPYQSFDSIVNAVTQITNANLALAQSKGWPTNRDDVANWVDEFNAYVCQVKGWGDYIIGGTAAGVEPPKTSPLHAPAGAVAAGAKTLAEWIGSGAQPVTKDKATARAAVCVACPILQQGDLSNFFTRAASELIRMQIATAKDLELETKHDDKLGVCGACSCPMKLKVWTPITHVLKNILPESKTMLDPKCWILSEETPA